MSAKDEIANGLIDIAKSMVERDARIRALEAELAALRDCVYETKPGEMEFGGEGWTYKQAFESERNRRRELEAELAEHNEAVRDRDVLAKWIKGQRCCMNPCGGVRTATPDVASAIAKAAIEGSNHAQG